MFYWKDTLQIDFSQMDTETQEKFLADLFEKALQKNLQAYLN
ncbi:hypothetical protein [Helicobacter pylori]|nr:hypothetical protein [Helicobacter pylori]